MSFGNSAKPAGVRADPIQPFAASFIHRTAPPREWAERFYNVQRWTQMPAGGHFAALEEPALLAEDIRAFFRPLRPGS